MVSRPPGLSGLPILVISTSAGTATGMRDYLEGAGGRIATASSLDAVGPTAARAVVVFADDFSPGALAAALRRLESRDGEPVIVLVSADPAVAARLGESANVVRVPRPAWSWSVLEAIRARLLATASEERESP